MKELGKRFDSPMREKDECWTHDHLVNGKEIRTQIDGFRGHTKYQVMLWTKSSELKAVFAVWCTFSRWVFQLRKSNHAHLDGSSFVPFILSSLNRSRFFVTRYFRPWGFHNEILIRSFFRWWFSFKHPIRSDGKCLMQRKIIEMRLH